MIPKAVFFLGGEIKTPPFSIEARREAGYLVRMLQEGILLEMPISRPMPNIGQHCHELRIQDTDKSWRIIYRIDSDAILIAEIFIKKTQTTPKSIITVSKARFKHYDFG